MELRLTNVRAAFLNVFEAKAVNGEGDPRFSGTFLFEPNSDTHKAIKAAIAKVAEEQWKGKARDVMTSLAGADRLCIHDPSKPDANGVIKAEKYQGFEGQLFLSASRKTRPLVIDADKTPLTQADGRPYSGCYVNVLVDIWAQDNQWGKRVNATLMGVQFYRDGDAFGGGRQASMDDFETVGDAGNDDAFGDSPKAAGSDLI